MMISFGSALAVSRTAVVRLREAGLAHSYQLPVFQLPV
jgi:hypothetical protein